MAEKSLYAPIFSHLGESFRGINPAEVTKMLETPESPGYQQIIIPVARMVIDLLKGETTKEGFEQKLQLSFPSKPLPERLLKPVNDARDNALGSVNKLGIKKIEQKLQKCGELGDFLKKLDTPRPSINGTELPSLINQILTNKIDGYYISTLIYVGASLRKISTLAFLNGLFGTKVRWEKNNITVTLNGKTENGFSLEEAMQYYIEGQIVALISETIRGGSALN